MFMQYGEALEWIHSRLKLGVKPGLKRMEWMLKRMGHPENKLKAIHVGGTNGKGSTVAYLRSILNEAGYQVGTFTSPYIEHFNERISVNGHPISDGEITELVNIIKPLADELEQTELGSPTEFEVITAMAIYYFSKVNSVDITIFEVGLGGRYDSTNVIKPLISIITSIGMDHTQLLGNSLAEIAYQKAGIIKNQIPLITSVQSKAAFNVIKQEAVKMQTKVSQLGTDFFIKNYKTITKGEQFTYESASLKLETLELSLMGRHQVENAAGAVAAIEYLNEKKYFLVTSNAIRTGLKKTYWPGRFEILSENPTVILDGAHNPEGMQTFASVIENHFANKKVKIVLAALKDKDLGNMFHALNSMNADIYFTEFDFPRAASAAELNAASNHHSATIEVDWRHLTETLISTLKQDEVLAIIGSLYFISTVKPTVESYINKLLKEQNM